VVIASGATLVLWSSSDAGELARRIVVILALVGINFYMHGRILMERPANRQLITVTSALDLVAVGLLATAVGGDGGLDNPYYVLVFPVLFALSLVVPTRSSLIAIALTLSVYTALCIAFDTGIATSAADAKTLVIRLLAIGATGGLGAFFWRVQRRWERDERRTLTWQPTAPAQTSH
jgi:hypothetical protein